MVEYQSGFQVKRFRTDNGGEYINKTLKDYFKSKGIIHNITAPYSPQSNGIAERYN